MTRKTPITAMTDSNIRIKLRYTKEEAEALKTSILCGPAARDIQFFQALSEHEIHFSVSFP